MKIADVLMDQDSLEQGARLELKGLENHDGEPVEAWIDILYIYSDAAQAALASAMRADFESGQINRDERDGDLMKRYAHTLVKGWSFEDDCTPENVQQLFRLSPDIRNRVIAGAERKRLFFPKRGKSSSAGSKKNSNS